MVEYKNPYNARDMTISEAVERMKNFCLTHNEDSRLRLKAPTTTRSKPPCFANWCDFVFKTCTLKGSGLMNSFGPKLCLNSKLPFLMLYFLNWLAQRMSMAAYANHQNGSKANRTLSSPCTHLLQPIMKLTDIFRIFLASSSTLSHVTFSFILGTMINLYLWPLPFSGSLGKRVS